MFEQEIQMEEQEGRGIGPFFIIIALVALLLGGIGYMVVESNRMLKTEEASAVIEKALKDRPVSGFKFHTGHLVGSVSDSVNNPQYKLLASANFITIRTDKKTGAADILLTPAGEAALDSINNLGRKDEGDGTTLYSVPLANRRFEKIDNIKKISAKRFDVTYTWQWQPNQVGDVFDANGQYVKKFNTWDRTQLIDKYGADFFHAPPTTETLSIVKTPDGWELAKE